MSENMAVASVNTDKPENVMSKQQRVIYCPMKTLQHMSAVAISVHLCMQKDVEAKIIRSLLDINNIDYMKFNYEVCQAWGHIKDYIIKKIHRLFFPPTILMYLSDITRSVLKEFVLWIKYQTCCIDVWSEEGHLSYGENMVWSTKGVVDYSASVMKLLLANSLPAELKYKLACTFCLEDIIVALEPEVSFYGFLEFLEVESDPMTYFWSSQMSPNVKELLKKSPCSKVLRMGNRSLNEFVFSLLFNHPDDPVNEISMRFLWDTLSDEEKARNIENLLMERGHTNLKCYVLSQLKPEEEEMILGRYTSGAFVHSLYFSELWNDHFLPTMACVKNKISSDDFIYVMSEIAKEARKHLWMGGIEYYKHADVIHKLWSLAPKRLKTAVFRRSDRNMQHEMGVSLANVLWRLSLENSFDLFSFILSDGTPRQRKKIILSHWILQEFSRLMLKDKWDLLARYTTFCIYSESDIVELKEKFVENGIPISVGMKLVRKNQWNTLDKMLDFIFTTDDEKILVRRELALSSFGTFVSEYVQSNKPDTAVLDHSLLMCLRSEEVVNDFRSSLVGNYDVSQLNNVVWSLVEKNNCNMGNELLNWCFLYDSVKIEDFKKKYWNAELSYMSKLISYIQRHDFETTDRIISWCFGSKKDIVQFKNTLMLCPDMHEVVDELTDTAAFTTMFRWFNPTIDTALSFKDMFLSEMPKECAIVKTFYELLGEQKKRRRFRFF